MQQKMLIDLFINAGWFTVPLKGELKRLPNGKKTLPHFETDWRKKYTELFNKQQSTLAGAITGKCSNIIAIDCDNQLTYNMFKTFDPDYAFHFVSKGKPEGGGTIIYKYVNDIGNFKLHTNDGLSLDFYSDEGFIYLPTENNETKESWSHVENLPELKECPPIVLALLSSLKAKTVTTIQSKDRLQRHVVSNRLAPMLEQFIKGKKYDPVLFKILTPYSFRNLPTYVTRGHLHPNDVPKGRGSEYLSKISAILGADISVSVEIYTNTIMLINSLWDDPMEKGKLMATIINPMVEERACIDGQPIWQYDAHWEKMGFIATTLNGDYVESFYDDIKGLYYIINYSIPYIKAYSDKRPALTTLKTLTGRQVTEVQYDTTKQLIRTGLNPNLEFGHIEGTDEFNLFRQTTELAIINNPEPYKPNYNRPTTILSYLETFIPDDFMRQYVLSFIKTKFTTFHYSPVILYFIGKPGSGKDTFVNILREILGPEYIAKPDTKVFLENYNGWMIDKYIVQLDEYGNKLVKHADKQEALGRLKAYTGSEEMQIRAMRTDGFNYKHSVTFILTANSNPLPIEVDDRRVAFIKTPNKLAQAQWVQEHGGIVQVQERIRLEIQDFCYYLATEVPKLKMDQFVIAPETEDRENMIIEGLPAAERIAYYLQNSKYEELISFAAEYGVDDITENWDKNKLEDSKLEKLYDIITEGAGSHNVIIRALKNIGLSRSHTTKNGMNSFYYFIPDIHRFAPSEGGFKSIDNVSKITPKGM